MAMPPPGVMTSRFPSRDGPRDSREGLGLERHAGGGGARATAAGGRQRRGRDDKPLHATSQAGRLDACDLSDTAGGDITTTSGHREDAAREEPRRPTPGSDTPGSRDDGASVVKAPVGPSRATNSPAPDKICCGIIAFYFPLLLLVLN